MSQEVLVECQMKNQSRQMWKVAPSSDKTPKLCVFWAWNQQNVLKMLWKIAISWNIAKIITIVVWYHNKTCKNVYYQFYLLWMIFTQMSQQDLSSWVKLRRWKKCYFMMSQYVDMILHEIFDVNPLFLKLKIWALEFSYAGQHLYTVIYIPTEGVLHSDLSWIFRKKWSPGLARYCNRVKLQKTSFLLSKPGNFQPVPWWAKLNFKVLLANFKPLYHVQTKFQGSYYHLRA